LQICDPNIAELDPTANGRRTLLAKTQTVER
jgi:hypothetical protein